MKNSLLFCLLTLFSMNTFAQIPESEAIDKIFADWNTTKTPGCALGIIKDGELIYAKGYGLANMEYDIPNSSKSVFRIGSTAKQFTAACIILLAEKEKLSLEDKLSKFFPDFPDYAHDITIQHLLNHTSGLRDYLQVAYLKGLVNDAYYTDQDIMRWLVRQTSLNFEPGAEFLYCNSGYWLLGQIVNQVAGRNMAEFAAQEIFKPLGMSHTHFHNDHNRIVKNRASGYAPSGEDTYQISMTTLDMIGDGGIFTTIEDIKKWDDAYYQSETLSTQFWEMMTKQGKLNSGEELDYASGLSISTYKGLKTVSHGGAFVGFRAELLRFPEQRFSVAIFANRSDADPTGMAYRVVDVMLKDELKAEPEAEKEATIIETPATEFSFAQLTGDYELEPGIIATLSIKNDSLNVLQNWNSSTYNIARVSGNTFEIPDFKGVNFTFSDLKEDQTQIMTILQEGNKIQAKRREPVDISDLDLNDYVGSYYCEELDATYHFELDKDMLKARMENNESLQCMIAKIDHFSLPFGNVYFFRENGIVLSFNLDSGRAKNLQFIKQ